MEVVRKRKSGGIVVGIIFVFIGIVLLWLNEGSAAKMEATIKEAKDQYIDVSSDKVDTSNEGKLIATTGKLEVSQAGATDSTFNIHVANPKLQRTVEMYQWDEDCENDEDGNSVCSYNTVWDDEIIDSNSFEDTTHNNPSSMPYSSESFVAGGSKVGMFTLSDDLLEQLNADKKVELQNNAIATNMGLTSDGTYYTNVQNGTPKVGDIRISFSYSDAKDVSVLAVQKNGGFSKFTSTNGYEIYELEQGTLSGQEILQNLSDENNLTKWIFRLVGIICVIGGFSAMVEPLQRLANYIPIFGTLFGWVTGIITFVLGLALSLVVIALAWLRYRPVLSIGLLIGVILVVILVKKFKAKNSSNLGKNLNTPVGNINTQNMSANPVNTPVQNTPVRDINTQNISANTVNTSVQNTIPNQTVSSNINEQNNQNNINSNGIN